MTKYIRFYSFLSIAFMGCSEPFEVDRHDLIAPRVLGVRLSDSGYFVQVWNGNGPWHTEPPEIVWYDSQGIALGESVHLEPEFGVPSSLIYTDPSGQDHPVQFDLVSSAVELKPSLFDLGVVNGLDLGSRIENLGEPWTGSVVPDALRIQIENEELGNTGRMRWMSSFGKGTFLERSAFQTDFFRSDIQMDRDEVLQNEPLDFEYTAVFALYVDGLGGNQWTWIDLWYSDVERIEVSGRSIPLESDVTDSWNESMVPFVLNQTDTDFGWSLTPTDGEVEPLPCAIDDGPFQWIWIEIGLCTISDVDGEVILLEVP